jgi:hypothetical protein
LARAHGGVEIAFEMAAPALGELRLQLQVR